MSKSLLHRCQIFQPKGQNAIQSARLEFRLPLGLKPVTANINYQGDRNIANIEFVVLDKLRS